MTPRTSTTGSPRRTAAIGVVAFTVTVATAGVAYAVASIARPAADVAADDAAPLAPAVDADLEVKVPAAPVLEDYFPGAEEYTQERSDAFWGAGYHMEDAGALAELWNVSLMEAKGRAGQLLLDGEPVPIAPGSSLDMTDPATIAMLESMAYWDAGYTHEDGVTLGALWGVDAYEAKAMAGKMLHAGHQLPITPSGTPSS
ncbi:hypothetical protein J1G44_07325 [Cellulomonas sp. zg-ZUI199]|uniref:SCP domain-containing protein n=1 Tax=Cellulomonas wangleii TaxID=2816956 RepID=A0ABX8D4A7_9CELL|nr:hypothetical protein [Cellulomonas wangleii]MBO0924294.1 hypothetical protein [Cellulomonas wangleii]QVI62304.1 hypothetical protein KG103_18170 [Cellulomonas wangleii]